MAATAILLGVDVGTSATKAIVVDGRDSRNGDGGTGVVLGAAEAGHAISRPRPGFSEQDPQWWWEACTKAIVAALGNAGVRGEDIRAVGLSGQMHGAVLLAADANPNVGETLRPAILWNDQRSTRQCEYIEECAGGREALIRMVGNPALTGLTAPKLLWVRDNEPAVFERIAHMILPKDYINWRLTGEVATDVGEGSGTLLLDPRTRQWHDELIGLLGIDRAVLPRCVESQEVIGAVSEHAAAAMGLAAGTPVVCGSGDQMCGAVGAGVIRDGVVSATLGTSGVVFAHAGGVVPDDVSGKLQIMCAAVPGEYCVYGCMLAAAGAVQWFREAIAPELSFAEIDVEAEAVEPGAEGLFFLPYLSGERCPHADPDARGAFIGLSSRHTRAHMARAVLEGVAFTMAQMLDLARGMGIEPGEVRMLGGGSKSRLWRQMHADIFNAPVTTLNAAEGSAYGAAILAGVGGAAIWNTVGEACDACLSEQTRLDPEVSAAGHYRELKPRFAELYPALRGHFHQMAESDD